MTLCHSPIWLILCFAVFLGTGPLRAQTDTPATVEEAIRARQQPMHTDGLDKRLMRFLENYYAANFGGADNWAQIESVRFDGRLHLPEGSVRFLAYKKKPDLIKVVVYLDGGEFIMAYDGRDAWQMDTRRPEAMPVDMPPDEALNFIRDATTGGHLLYPQMPGKVIEFGSVRTIEDASCLDVTVTLPNGQTVTYAVGLGNSGEKQQITVNAVSGQTEVVTHHAYRMLGGVRFPVNSTLTIDGETIHRVEMVDITLNKGATSWMFQRPSAGFVPPAEPIAPPALTGGDAAVAPFWAPGKFSEMEIAPLSSILETLPRPAP